MPNYAEYDRIHRQIPIAGRIADALTNSVYASYTLDNANVEQRVAIDTSFRENDFPTLFGKIVEDTIIFGDSYLEITQRSPLRLTRIDPVQATFNHGWTNRGGGRAMVDALESVIVNQRNISYDDIIQFSHRVINGPFGFSAYGEWFPTWQGIEQALEVIGRGGNGQAVWNLDYFESQVLTGADGLPDSLLTRNLSRFALPLSVGRGSPFDLFIQERRTELKEVVEREIFPIVLNAEWDWRNFPQFEIHGNLRFNR